MTTTDVLLVATVSVSLGSLGAIIASYRHANRQGARPHRLYWSRLLYSEVRATLIVSILATILAAIATTPLFNLIRERGSNGSRNRVGMVGGCPSFVVYAQNKWQPVGAVKRPAPQVTARDIGVFGPNRRIVVDGFVHASV